MRIALKSSRSNEFAESADKRATALTTPTLASCRTSPTIECHPPHPSCSTHFHMDGLETAGVEPSLSRREADASATWQTERTPLLAAEQVVYHGAAPPAFPSG